MAIISSAYLDALGIEAKSTKTASALLLNESSSAAPSEYFDIFLSHSFSDAQKVSGRDILRLKRLLERFGFSVYVDWIEDPELDRTRVTPRNANILRRRMDHSESLLFVTSANSSASTWMPWELGYMDGKTATLAKLGKVAIFPFSNSPARINNYYGQQFLGLYPHVVQHRNRSGHAALWVEWTPTKYVSIQEWISDHTIPHDNH